MSRTVIFAVVAALILAITGFAYYSVSSASSDRARRNAEFAASRAKSHLMSVAQLESLSVQNKAEQLRSDPGFVAALKGNLDEGKKAFQRFKGGLKVNDVQPDIMALVDKNGNLVAMQGLETVVPKQWKTDQGQLKFLGLAEALKSPLVLSEIWDYTSGAMMKVGIASIIDPDVLPTKEAPLGAALGAVVIAYEQTSRAAQNDADNTGVDVAYVSGTKTFATSFRNGDTRTEDTTRSAALSNALAANKEKLFSGKADALRMSLAGTDYVVIGLPMPRQSSRDLGDAYPKSVASALVLAPVTDGGTGSLATKILMVGIASLVLALLGMYLTHRRLVTQVDPIELGIADIINGNIDRSFRPVGAELDGLANGLNVMMARLLGRPEPGDEEFDEEGNPVVPGRVEFDDAEAPKGPDPELAALAQESEPDYYKRIFTEYLAARKAIGQPDEVSFENFIAKLKMNEGKLKAQHQCKAVRFRVVQKDGKVSLKPVPIFA